MDIDDMLPSSGEEYLRMVKAQARACPAVVIATVAQEHLSVKNTSQKYQTDWKSCRPAPEGCAPSAEWQEHFMLEFRIARDNFQRFKQTQESTIKTKGRRRQAATEGSDKHDQSIEAGGDIPHCSATTATLLSSPSIPKSMPLIIPNLYDEQGWRRLLYGTQTSTSGQGRSAICLETDTTAAKMAPAKDLVESGAESCAVALNEASDIDSDTVKTPRTTGDQANQYQGISPHPRFLVRLNQGHLIQLLKYHLRWLAEDDLTDQEVQERRALFLF
ncbi:gem (nuclear organelle) associated protein 2 [Mortierella alpina]|nr:gem (nuclear organelle) associated protein 2 [Mortierella alpina]